MPPQVTWLGQAGFLFQAAGTRILVDPFLAGHEERAYPPPPLDAVAGPGCDWLLVTHDHLDHLDVESLPRIAARSSALRVAVPEPLAERVRELAPGVETVAVTAGQVLGLGAAGRAIVVPAIHADDPFEGYSEGSGRYVGYVLELDGVAIYHAGDTLVTGELLAALGGLRIDVALLPVNGRSFFRERQGLAGNMDFREAVGLAREVGATMLVPIHWDLFAGNSERPGAAADEAAATDAPLHVVVLRRGLPWIAAAAR